MTVEQASSASREPYWVGVRRRLGDAAVIGALLIVSLLAIYGIYEASHLVPLTLAAAVLCGVASERLALKTVPLALEGSSSKPGKALWLTLFGPCILLLMAILTYYATTGVQGTQLFGTILVACLLGNMASATYRVLKW